MTYVNITGGGQLESSAAAAWERLDAAYKARFGVGIGVTSALRTFAEQARLYDGWIHHLPGFYLAAPPGYSLHEKGHSVDVAPPADVLGSAEHAWLVANAPSFGWKWTGQFFHPAESWHFDYVGGGGPSTGAISQDVLNRQNYLNVTFKANLVADGIDGPKTQAAVAVYQRLLGVTADGVWGPKTQAAHQAYYDAHHQPAPAPAAPPANANGEELKQVQHALRTKYPLYAGKLVEDGIDGPNTRAAVKEFQRRAGLVQDGVPGPRTRAALGL